MATLNRLECNKQLFNSICGVNLYIHQRIRDLKRDNNMTAVVYDNNLENATIILNYEEYKENPDGEIRVYKTRDSFINAMYEEIQANYQKTLGEVLTPKEEINSKKI